MNSEILIQNSARRWWVTLPTMWLPLLASFFYFIWYPGTVFGNSFYSGIKVFLLIWPLIAVGWILREKFVDLSRPKEHRKSILVGTVFGFTVVGLLMFLLKATPLSFLIDDNRAQIAKMIEGLGVVEHFLLFAFFLSVIHSALEEFFWRWFVFGQLRKIVAMPAAHILAAMGFASHHIVILSQFFPLGWAFALGTCVGIGGAMWSWMYQKHNSLAGAWVSHMIVDFGIMWIGWEILN